MPNGPTNISTIGFDADDTLWHNEQYFKLTEQRFRELLQGHAEPEDLAQRLLDAERRNLKLYGYGVKGFTLSMIETALEITGGKVPTETISDILHAGRDLLAQPIEVFEGAGDVLEALRPAHQLVLITKGDLFDQERKLAQSGLAELFTTIEIVSEKTKSTYERIFADHNTPYDHAMMVGNSLRSDVIPALQAGSWGVHVPHEVTWEHEHAEEPVAEPRYRLIDALHEVLELLPQSK